MHARRLTSEILGTTTHASVLYNTYEVHVCRHQVVLLVRKLYLLFFLFVSAAHEHKGVRMFFFSSVCLPACLSSPSLCCAVLCAQHFKSHRDTPRDELAFGTLVVALPSTFTGGSLVVRHRDSTHACDWETKLEGHSYGGEKEFKRFVQAPKNALQW